ncbi:PIN domain-containing protein [Synechocystis sp. LEGE 06083]|uniref:PIN domain-containing protein n=1 Tax=Synechocystis sp. LEGE 06083 TaxID=915336 RepID=UPI001D14966D|nr:PIN domain-containing protein [Synechocystis sp. LEGE 06083]
MSINGKFVLDINIIIALFADEIMVKKKLITANEIFIPSIVIGELCYGAITSGRVQANLERVSELIANGTVLSCDAETAW